jgi:hypothetical protein
MMSLSVLVFRRTVSSIPEIHAFASIADYNVQDGELFPEGKGQLTHA